MFFLRAPLLPLCVFLVSLKVFEEHLVLSLGDDDDVEEHPSSLCGRSSLSLSLSVKIYHWTATSKIYAEWMIYSLGKPSCHLARP